jgi:hypothetical protein
MKTVSDSMDSVKEAADKVMNKPEVKNAVDSVKDQVNKVTESAKVHFAKVTEKPEVQKIASSAEEGFKRAADIVSDSAKAAAKKIDEVINSPDVQSAIVKTRKTAADLFNSALSGIQSVFRKDDQDADEASDEENKTE